MQAEPDICTRCTVAWQPGQGELLAAPGPKGFVLYERDSWHPAATLAEEGEIHTLCFSPDGAQWCVQHFQNRLLLIHLDDC